MIDIKLATQILCDQLWFVDIMIEPETIWQAKYGKLKDP